MRSRNHCLLIQQPQQIPFPVYQETLHMQQRALRPEKLRWSIDKALQYHQVHQGNDAVVTPMHCQHLKTSPHASFNSSNGDIDELESTNLHNSRDPSPALDDSPEVLWCWSRYCRSKLLQPGISIWLLHSNHPQSNPMMQTLMMMSKLTIKGKGQTDTLTNYIYWRWLRGWAKWLDTNWQTVGSGLGAGFDGERSETCGLGLTLASDVLDCESDEQQMATLEWRTDASALRPSEVRNNTGVMIVKHLNTSLQLSLVTLH